MAVASNAPFSEWGTTFTDPRLAAAVVDRLTFKAHIIETGSDSYPLRATRAGPRPWALALSAPRAGPGECSSKTSVPNSIITITNTGRDAEP